MGKQNKYGTRFTEKRAVWTAVSNCVCDYFDTNGAESIATSNRHRRSKSEQSRRNKLCPSTQKHCDKFSQVPEQPNRFLDGEYQEKVDVGLEKKPVSLLTQRVLECNTLASRQRSKSLNLESEPLPNSAVDCDLVPSDNECNDPMEIFRRNRRLIPETVTIDTLLLPSPVSADDVVPNIWIPSKRNGKYGRKNMRGGGSKSCGVYSPLSSHFERAMSIAEGDHGDASTTFSKSCVSIPINRASRTVTCSVNAEQLKPSTEASNASIASTSNCSSLASSTVSSQSQNLKSLAKARRKAQYRADRAQFELSDTSIMV